MNKVTNHEIKTFTLSSLQALQAHSQGLDPSLHGAKWDELWTEEFSPWDRGAPNPALIDVLAKRKDLVGSATLVDGKRKKALVPGLDTMRTAWS